jgi:hypothetical protein
MTIPDIGHCAGSGSAPIHGTIQDDGGQRSGVCGACSRRVELGNDGSLSFHHSIAEQPSEPLGTEAPPSE